MITILNDLRKQLDLLEKDNIDLYKKNYLLEEMIMKLLIKIQLLENLINNSI